MTDNLFSIEGKTALVTGGTRGIGYMIAEGYLRGGARVFISSRKKEACEEAQRTLSAHGDVVAIPADLSSESEAQRLIEDIKVHTDSLDILVNNAGASWGAPLDDYPDKGWDRVMDVNLRGPFHLTRYARPLLEAASTPGSPSRIINIGSIDGLMVPVFDNYAYSASKAGVMHLTRHLAAAMAPSILVNAIAPGPFPSKMMEIPLATRGDEIRSMSRLGRIGEPDDVAALAIFLAARASTFITGAVIPLDGGISTTGPANVVPAL